MTIPKDIEAILDTHEGLLDEVIHDLKSEEASFINNGGDIDQLEFLRESGCIWDEIREIVLREVGKRQTGEVQ